MPNRPIDILKSLPGLAGWSAVSRKTLRYELFFNGQGVENRRVVEDLGGHVTLLARNGKEFGVAGFDISGAGETDFRRQLDQAVARARVGAEPAFELPGPPASYGRVFLVDPGVRDNADVMPLRVRSAIETGLAGAPGVHLSMAEVSVAKTREAVINSAGAAAENDLSDYEVELVLLAGAGSREQERLVSFRRRRFEDMNLSAQVAVEAQRALDRVEAGAPAAGPTAVILGDGPLGEFIAFLVRATSGAAVHRRRTPLAVGRPVADGRPGDPLYLEVNALFPFGPESYRIDEWGAAGVNVRVIDKGVFVRPHADPRYASLLKLPEATGRPGTAQMPPGTVSAAELRGGSCLEIVAFSDVIPDPVSGRFSAEIRLGYEVRDGRRRPVTGGTLSGNILEAFWRARYSKEVGLHDRYAGPDLARVEDGLTVTA